jgi:hypothetical protein
MFSRNGSINKGYNGIISSLCLEKDTNYGAMLSWIEKFFERAFSVRSSQNSWYTKK